jgi:hypothetical protein
MSAIATCRGPLAIAPLLAVLVGCAQAAPRFAPGAELTLAASDAGNPTVANDPTSDAHYIVWIETRDSVADVYLTRSASGERGEVVRVNDVRGDAAPHDQAPPQVAVGPDGSVYVVWQNSRPVPGRRFPASNLRFARSTDGGLTFEPAIHVNDDADGPPSSHTFHDIAVAADGFVYVSWIDGRERTRAELEPGHATSDAGHGGHGGHAMHDASLPGSEVRVAKSTDGGRTFGGSVVAATDVCPCCRTSITASADGRVFVAYRGASNNIRSIAVARSADAGASFAAPVIAHDDGWEIDGCPHAGASVALDAHGRLHVAWYTGAPERQGVWYAVSDDDARSFSAPRAVQTGGWVPVSQVKLAADGMGTVWVAWDDRRDPDSTVHVAPIGRGAVTSMHSVAGEHPAISAGSAGVSLVWRGPEGAARSLTLRPTS